MAEESQTNDGTPEVVADIADSVPAEAAAAEQTVEVTAELDQTTEPTVAAAEAMVATDGDEPAAPAAPPAPHLSPVDAEFRPAEIATTPEREVDGYEYEIIYIVEPGCDKDQIQEVSEKSRQIIEQGEGALDNVRTSQLRRLQFEIKGKRDGTYVVLNLRCKPPVTRELDRMFKLDERVLRHMVLRMDA